MVRSRKSVNQPLSALAGLMLIVGLAAPAAAWSSALFFPGRLGTADARGHQNTALIGGVWWFGNKQGAW